jgi:enoyl-[acyl-carrier protein] reductase III
MKKWALIIGGSSGMGLATSQKLNKHGFNLIIIHRDRRSLIPAFNEHLDEIKKTGQKVRWHQ